MLRRFCRRLIDRFYEPRRARWRSLGETTASITGPRRTARSLQRRSRRKAAVRDKCGPPTARPRRTVRSPPAMRALEAWRASWTPGIETWISKRLAKQDRSGSGRTEDEWLAGEIGARGVRGLRHCPGSRIALPGSLRRVCSKASATSRRGAERPMERRRRPSSTSRAISVSAAGSGRNRTQP